jgi:hypothetical protein
LLDERPLSLLIKKIPEFIEYFLKGFLCYLLLQEFYQK